jgi:sigma-B regulation protein RsbU (phosphoserine phosphatase)
MAAGGEKAHLAHLLRDVDEALTRMDAGTYGLCQVCNETVEIERLLGDPLLRTCLDHLTPAEQRALEQDLDLAARVQGGLLPKQHLVIPGWEASYHYEPAGAVSGDYCDLVGAGAGQEDFYFLLGDVAGKGMAASMLMAALRAIVRTLIDSRPSARDLVERANRLFCETALRQHFATLVCGKASPSGAIEICNAGHCPPLLVRQGRVTPLEATGLPVGLFTSSEYTVKEVRLGPGEALLLYTDGLSEARNRASEEYGVERLGRLLAARRDLPPKDLVAACLADVASFRSGAPRADDLTLLAIRRSAGA